MKIRFFLAAILKRYIFFYLLIYGCFGCIHVWCKFRAEIPTGKYSKISVPPFCHKLRKKYFSLAFLQCMIIMKRPVVPISHIRVSFKTTKLISMERFLFCVHTLIDQHQISRLFTLYKQ